MLSMATSNASSSFVGLLLLALLGFSSWVSWPVSLWVGAAFILHWALRTLAERLARAPARGGLLRALLAACSAALSRSVAWVGAGIALVAAAQAGLWLGAQWVEPAQVRQVEQVLSW